MSETLDEAISVAQAAKDKGIKSGVVQDKLYLPGLRKIKMLRDSGFFGRILSVRGEFGYWVFEGDWGQPAQRPSWNYRKKEGGGIILDMLPHWRYVLDNLFGAVEAVSCLGTTHIPSRVDEAGKTYAADADDAAYATFQLAGGAIAHINSSWCVRVKRDDLVTFQVDGTHGSAVAGLTRCFTQHRVNTPRPVWNPDEPQTMKFEQQWDEVPDNTVYENGFKLQWEEFIRHVVAGAPWKFDLIEGAKGVQLAELAHEELGRAALGRRAGACRPKAQSSRPREAPMTTISLPLPTGASRTTRSGTRPLDGHARQRARPATPRASPIRRCTSSPIRWPTTIPGSTPRSTGTRPSRSATTSGTSGSASPRRWTPRSAAWASTGRPRSS